KEAEADRRPTVGDQRVEQACQRHEAQDDAEAHQGEDAAADPAAAGGARHDTPPATCRRTSSRAITFSASVTRNSSSAISMSDAVNRSLGASANWLAMVLATVSEAASSDIAIRRPFPITIVTAIVSPSARPSARMHAPMNPLFAGG